MEETKEIHQHEDLSISNSINQNKKLHKNKLSNKELQNPEVNEIIDLSNPQVNIVNNKKTNKDNDEDINMNMINQVRVEYPHAGLSKIPFGTLFKYVNRLIVEKRYTNIPEEKRIEIVHLAQQLLDEQNNQNPQALLDDVYGQHSDSESERHQNRKKQINKIIKINKLKSKIEG